MFRSAGRFRSHEIVASFAADTPKSPRHNKNRLFLLLQYCCLRLGTHNDGFFSAFWKSELSCHEHIKGCRRRPAVLSPSFSRHHDVRLSARHGTTLGEPLWRRQRSGCRHDEKFGAESCQRQHQGKRNLSERSRYPMLNPDSEKTLEQHNKTVPLGSVAEPDDNVNVIAFLASVLSYTNERPTTRQSIVESAHTPNG